MIILAAALAAALSSAELVRIADPLALAMPREKAATWTSFADLSHPPAGGVVRIVAGRTAGRVDVFSRNGTEWLLSETFQYEPAGVALAASESRRAVLIRLERSEYYFWGEIPPHASSATIKPFKNLTFTSAKEASDFVLFVSTESLPRRLSGTRAFHLVPRAPALLCQSGPPAALCVAVPPDNCTASLPNGASPAVVVHAPAQTRENFVAKAPGYLPIHPKIVGSTLARAGAWAAIALEDPRYSWRDVVLDWSGDTYATERIEGRVVAELPGFTEIPARLERGVTIRASVGTSDHPLADSSALLLAFPATSSATSSRIPIASAGVSEDGIILMPELGDGDYRLKLLSNDATGEPQPVSVFAGQVTDVTFPSGPAINGRVALTTGGAPSDPVIIEVTPAVSVADALNDRGLTDKIRVAAADPNGHFRIVLGFPGKYCIRARWGAAAGRLDIELPGDSSEIDVGEIPLHVGSTLHGSLPGCPDGDIRVIPVPDLKTFTTAMGEVRRTRIDSHGRFTVEGLTPGNWSVVATCGFETIDIVPPVVAIADNGDTVVAFSRATQTGPSR